MRKIKNTLKSLFVAVLCGVVLVACNKSSETPTIGSKEIFEAGLSGVAGNGNGEISIVEFFDYRCHICKQNISALHAIVSIDPSVRVVYRDLPILGPLSTFAAKASIASSLQGKFMPFHDALFRLATLSSEEEVLSVAESVGLDVERLKIDMESDAVKMQLADNMAVAKALKIMGTPSFMLGKTTWQNGKINVTGATLKRGGLRLVDLKNAILEVRLAE